MRAGRRRGLRDLAIAVALGALVWIADGATGGHLARALNGFAGRLADWYEDRRSPLVTCEPGKARPYTALAGVVLQVPWCWEVEVVPLLDREVHRFHDPEARAGSLSVSVEPIESDDDRRALSEEFERMKGLRGARASGDADGSAAGDSPRDTGWKPSVPDSLAERILHHDAEESAGASANAVNDPNGTKNGNGTNEAATPAGGTVPAAGAFRVVEAGGLIGTPPKEGGSARQPDGSYAKRTWTWLLLGDRSAVRIVYAVRADWSNSSVVAREFKRASALASSVKAAP